MSSERVDPLASNSLITSPIGREASHALITGSTTPGGFIDMDRLRSVQAARWNTRCTLRAIRIQREQMRTNHAFAVGIAAVALWTAAASGSADTTRSGEAPLQRFHEAVDAYMSLREVTEQTVPAPEISADWENIRIAVDAMADAIRAARPSAKEGDIFAEAAPLFRRRIRETLRGPDCQPDDILAARGDDDQLPASSRPIVHDRFDWGAGSFMAFCILEVLPELPEELQFRFVERDMVLVDIDADLVVDVLPDALPPNESWMGIRYARLRSVPLQPRTPEFQGLTHDCRDQGTAAHDGPFANI
jgi:hypothetical protein